MNSLKPGFADELLKLALYDRLLALFRLSPWIILGMLLLVILFFLLNFNRLESGKRIQETDNAYTQLDRVVLEAKVNGYVAQVGFGDFQQVKTGDVLLRVQDAAGLCTWPARSAGTCSCACRTPTTGPARIRPGPSGTKAPQTWSVLIWR